MRITYLLALATGSLLTLVACSSDDGESSGSGGTSGSAGSGGSAGSTGGSGGSAGGSGGSAGSTGGTAGSGGGDYVDCPETLPSDGASCSEDGLNCTYGDDPRFQCRDTAICIGSSWTVSPSTDARCAEDPRPPSCPATPPSGGMCSGPDQCVYEDGTSCLCTSCPPGDPVCMGGDPMWHCTPPQAGCPARPPNAGTRCGMEGQRCDYTCDLNVTCTMGAWVWQRGNCPICAAPDTPIATPSGDRPIAELRVGDVVYSVEGEQTVAVPLVRVGRTAVRSHTVLEVRLDDGAVLHMSAGHPTADGRAFSQLARGDSLGGRTVVSAERVPYEHSHTYDILPASPSGAYFAAGALVGSTLAPGACE